MTRDTFDTLKTIIKESELLMNLAETEPDRDEQDEVPNVRDRLLDGANLIDLYIEFWDHIIWCRFYKPKIDEDELEYHFWKIAEETLTDKP